MTLPIEQFGREIAAKRGSRGVRITAAEIGISPATLSRVENGAMPDLQTFARVCDWLGRDPAEFLGLRPSSPQDTPTVMAHWRKKKTVSKETAVSLAELILSTQRAVQARNRLLDE